MPSPYQSPTKRLAVEVLIDDGSRLVGDVYLHPNTMAPGGYESPLTMIDDHAWFYPVSEQGGAVALVGKRRTVSLSYASPGDAAVPESAAATDRVSLEVLLSDGSTLSGWALLELPRAQPRTLDFLNGPGSFVTIHDEARIHLVNRAHIRTVHPLD
jgi:hypothetical protein